MLVVQKFGGSSVANKERVLNVAKIITDTYKEGNSVIAVVSAQGDTTDILIDMAKEINPNPSKREMDVLLSTGEQVSMSLLAMAIEKLGFPVVSLTGWQIGMMTSLTYGDARISAIVGERIKTELAKKKIVIVAGFQGLNKYDDITTLGRGGSDTTAVAIAASLNADVCKIYTDVDGVFTADPRIVPDAIKLDAISYDEMLELASLGANVLHNRSVEMAKKYNVTMEVLSSFTNHMGTLVKEVKDMEKMLIRGVAKDTNVARIAVMELDDSPGIAFKLFSLLAKEDISVDVIIQSIGRENRKDISFTVKKDDLGLALDILNRNKDYIGFEEISYDDQIAKVSIVGAGMAHNPGVATKMFEALYEVGVNINMITTSEIKVSVLIDVDKADIAVKSVHKKFIPDMG